MTTRRTVFVLQLAALSVGSFGPSSDAMAQTLEDRVYPPHSVVEGRTIGEWTVEFTKWLGVTPPARNPNFAPDIECSSGQDELVFFLPLMGSGETRSCVLPEDVPVFVPLAVSTWAYQRTDRCANAVALVREELDSVTVLELEINGQTISSEALFEHREQTEECFAATLPNPNVLGRLPGLWGTVATGGYVLLVRPLGPGRHVIWTRFMRTRPDNIEVDVERTWTLHVEGPAFRRGDANDDGNVNISDVSSILGYLFLGDDTSGCRKTADANDDGTINITDAVTVLNYLFSGGTQPPDPFAACGADPTEDDLTCEAYTYCE